MIFLSILILMDKKRNNNNIIMKVIILNKNETNFKFQNYATKI